MIDNEEFCARCFAGVESDEHHSKCVNKGFAEDGETAWGNWRNGRWVRKSPPSLLDCLRPTVSSRN